MSNCPLQVMPPAVDPYEILVLVHQPADGSPTRYNPFLDFFGEHRPEPVPAEPHRLMANVDSAFMQQILHVRKRQWEPDVHHNRAANGLGARFEIAKGAALGHAPMLCGPMNRLKTVCSDKAGEDLKRKNQAVIAARKPKKVALTAVMRKLIELAAILIQKDRTGMPKPA